MCHVPIDVANVEDLTIHTMHGGVCTEEFHVDWRPPQIGGHGEVRDRRDERDTSGDVVENTILAGLRQSETHEGDCRAGHHGGDRPVPIRTANGNGNVDGFAILRIRCKGRSAPVLDGTNNSRKDVLLISSALLPILESA